MSKPKWLGSTAVDEAVEPEHTPASQAHIPAPHPSFPALLRARFFLLHSYGITGLFSTGGTTFALSNAKPTEKTLLYLFVRRLLKGLLSKKSSSQLLLICALNL
ncbi:MAG: hypothetical protein ACXVAV_14940 [Ktedonobacteraceae bacterium]